MVTWKAVATPKAIYSLHMETMFEVRFPNDAFMMQSTFRFRIILYDMYIQ